MKCCLSRLTFLAATALITSSSSLYPTHTPSDDSLNSVSPAAPLFPELTLQQPIKFSAENEMRMNSIEQRKKEWGTSYLTAPSWLATAAICTSLLIFYIRPLSLKRKIIKTAPKLIDGNTPEEVYSQLIDCLRHHLDEQWEIAAMESSLPENIQAIDSHSAFSLEQKKFLKESLSKAELIKFNRIAADQAECQNLFRQIALLFPSFFNEIEQEASQKKN